MLLIPSRVTGRSEPPHAFCPWIDGEELTKAEAFGDIWRGTGLENEKYYATRNDAVPLIVATQSGDITKVNQVLATGVDVHAVGLEGESALHMASALGHVDIASALVTAGANPEARDWGRSTPLVHCARFCPHERSIGVADVLLEAGADPKTTVTQDYKPLSPLCWAIRAGNTSLVRYLIPHSDRQFSYVMEESLSLSFRTGECSIMATLLEVGININAEHLIKALGCGEWNAFDLLVKKLNLPPTEFHDTIATALDDMLYQSIPKPGFSLPEVTERLFTAYGIDPNHMRIRNVILISGNPNLLQCALRHGLDLSCVPVQEVQNLLQECRDRGIVSLGWLQHIQNLQENSAQIS